MTTRTINMNLKREGEKKRKIPLICMRKLLLLLVIESDFREHARIKTV